MDKAIILASGGLNSTVMLAAAREQYQIALLHVSWGHRAAERERAAFDQIAQHYKVKQQTVVDLSSVAAFGGNARVSRRLPIEHGAYPADEPSPTFTPGLLPTLLGIATQWAATIKARYILIGTHEDHGLSGPRLSQMYPDYRQEFIQSYNLLLHYGAAGGSEIEAMAPLINVSREEIIRLGRQLKIPFNKTWSCYAGASKPCHKCLPCISRAEAFIQSGIPDPLEVEPVEV